MANIMGMAPWMRGSAQPRPNPTTDGGFIAPQPTGDPRARMQNLAKMLRQQVADPKNRMDLGTAKRIYLSEMQKMRGGYGVMS